MKLNDGLWQKRSIDLICPFFVNRATGSNIWTLHQCFVSVAFASKNFQQGQELPMCRKHSVPVCVQQSHPYHVFGCCVHSSGSADSSLIVCQHAEHLHSIILWIQCGAITTARAVVPTVAKNAIEAGNQHTYAHSPINSLLCNPGI